MKYKDQFYQLYIKLIMLIGHVRKMEKLTLRALAIRLTGLSIIGGNNSFRREVVN